MRSYLVEVYVPRARERDANASARRVREAVAELSRERHADPSCPHDVPAR